MRTNKFTRILIVLIILFIAGCGYKYEVKTVIYEDGSCLRTLTLTCEDSLYDTFFDSDLNRPIPIDTTWNLVIKQDTNENGDTVFVHKATKFFESIEQVNNLYITDSSKYKVLDRSVKFEKRFRWFYTFFDFKESYEKMFDQPSLSTYLDSVHYNWVMLKDDEKEKYLEEKFDTIQAKKFEEIAELGFNKWIEFTITNACLNAIEKSAKNFKTLQFSESDFSRIRDSLNNKIDGDLDLFDGDDNLNSAVKRIFKIDTVLYKEFRKDQDFRFFSEKYNFWNQKILEEDYINIIAMPGLIIETNSTKVNEIGEVQWDIEWKKYFTEDYEMEVTSRIVNIWTFWVSGGFIFLLLIFLVIRRIYKRKK